MNGSNPGLLFKIFSTLRYILFLQAELYSIIHRIKKGCYILKLCFQTLTWETLNNLCNKKFKGKYAYTNELGSTIIVHYSAGANKGFVIENMDEIEEAMEEAQEAVAYAEMAIDAFSDDFFF